MQNDRRRIILLVQFEYTQINQQFDNNDQTVQNDERNNKNLKNREKRPKEDLQNSK